MSNQVTNVEIEDVLSSIRRLVAEGEKTVTPVFSLKNDTPVAATQPERFVLTPALRVAQPDEAGTDDHADLSPESTELAAQFVAPAPEPLILTPAAVVEVPLIHDAMSASERASLEETIAELEAAVTDQTDEWEPDGSEFTGPSALAEAFDDLGDDAVIEHGDIEEVPDDEMTTGAFMGGDQISSDFADSAEDDDDSALGLMADVVTLHEPVAAPEPSFRHTVMDDADDDFGDDLAEGDGDDGMPIPDDLDESIAAYIAGGSKMDDAELRAMIVDVVRQELQGEMGERITRNVRKLVRREINNALSSKSYT
jgi:hypothetical protein